jgi:hypothetical protein
METNIKTNRHCKECDGTGVVVFTKERGGPSGISLRRAEEIVKYLKKEDLI